MFVFISTKGLMSEASLERLMYWDVHVTRLSFPMSDSFQSLYIVCFFINQNGEKVQ